jgi:rhodanese-related sulfurtransferase
MWWYRKCAFRFLNNYMASIDRDATTYVHCAGGYRSMIAISILKARGFENLVRRIRWF